MDILPFDNILTGFRNRGSVTGAGISTGFVCELWAGSPNGTRQFFIVLDDRIVEGDVRRFRENSPGPDRSSVASVFPIRRIEFVCPFTVPSQPG